MPHTLEVWSGENNKRSSRNPSPEVIGRAIDALTPAQYHFVILEAEPHIEQCAYVQSLIEREGKNKGRYLVEARYVFDGRFNHYGKHVDEAGEVKALFRRFAEGIAPNVAGWNDITGKVSAATG